MKHVINPLKIVFMQLFVYGMFVLTPLCALAQGDVDSFGDVAVRLQEGLMSGLLPFINGFCYLMGIMFLIVGIKKYQGLHGNPAEVNFTVPLTYFAMGLITILIPLVYYLVKRTPGTAVNN